MAVASGTSVLGDVLERFQAAEVDGHLDVLRVTTDATAHLSGHGRAARGGPERLGDAALGQQRRIDPARERADLVQDVVHLPPHRREHALALGRVVLHRLGRHLELDAQADEMLLHAVVEIALEPAPLGMRHLEEAYPGRRHVRRGGLQIRLEPDLFEADQRRRARRLHEPLVARELRAVQHRGDRPPTPLDPCDRLAGRKVRTRERRGSPRSWPVRGGGRRSGATDRAAPPPSGSRGRHRACGPIRSRTRRASGP